MADTTEIEDQLKRKVDAFLADETRIDLFLTSDHLAVALILNRKDLLDSLGFTMLEAFERLDPKWLEAARKVERRYRAHKPPA